MTALSLEEAHAKLPELINRVRPGEEMTLSVEGQPVVQVKKT